MEIIALISNWNEVKNFLTHHLEQFSFDNKQKNEVFLACEEIYVNVSMYAYPESEGFVRISLDKDEDSKSILITFEDQGIKFNPLKVPDPKIRGNAFEREIGGLGIFMAKKLMDTLEYTHENGKNKLKLIKRLNDDRGE